AAHHLVLEAQAVEGAQCVRAGVEHVPVAVQPYETVPHPWCAAPRAGGGIGQRELTPGDHPAQLVGRFDVVHFEAAGRAAGAEVGLPCDESEGSSGPHHRDDLLVDRICTVPAGLTGPADTFACPSAVQRVPKTFGYRAADDLVVVDGRTGGGTGVRKCEEI